MQKQVSFFLFLMNKKSAGVCYPTEPACFLGNYDKKKPQSNSLDMQSLLSWSPRLVIFPQFKGFDVISNHIFF